VPVTRGPGTARPALRSRVHRGPAPLTGEDRLHRGSSPKRIRAGDLDGLGTPDGGPPGGRARGVAIPSVGGSRHPGPVPVPPRSPPDPPPVPSMPPFEGRASPVRPGHSRRRTTDHGLRTRGVTGGRMGRMRQQRAHGGLGWGTRPVRSAPLRPCPSIPSTPSATSHGEPFPREGRALGGLAMDLDAIATDTLHRHLAGRAPWRPDPPEPSSPNCPGCGPRRPPLR
jgi:hypothetical protein